jgi:hypothetical protein
MQGTLETRYRFCLFQFLLAPLMAEPLDLASDLGICKYNNYTFLVVI